jgi:hypothetical protein
MGTFLNGVCRLLAGAKTMVCSPAQEECAQWDTIVEAICDFFDTITQSICDATTTVTQTICDATATITETVCDAVKSIPFIGDLICFLSHTVSRVVCAVSHIVSTVVCAAAHIVSTTICALSHLVSKTLCVLWTIVKAIACVIVGGTADITCAVTGLLLGPGPILRSNIQNASSVPRNSSEARSVILATDLRQTADPTAPYDEEGIHVAYRLRNGVAEWSIGGAPFEAIVPDRRDLPPFANPPDAGPLAVSYDRLRLGDWATPPTFDMIASSGDRAIAKKVATDELFVLVTGNPYFHRVGDRRMVLPQSYFKLDPELGLKSAMMQDLVDHVTIPGDDERHPATERFPFFRQLFTLGAVHVPLPPLFRRVFRVAQIDIRLFRGAGELGLMQEMDVRFAARVWHKADLRPPRNGNEPPSRFPSYEHVVYASNDEPGAQEIARHSVSFSRVLDLGVGLSHLHEQHDNRFGGELDNLTDDRWNILGFPLSISDDAGYQLANGPIQDYGGWIDGTCIYYQLVQLKQSRDINSADPSTLRNAFAILWIDEQSAFTERWRVLHTDDNRFNSPFKPMVSVLVDSFARFYPEAPFDRQRYWCPFTEGHVTPRSRMSVVRQLVVVTGVDPATQQHELYSTHFSWPTMDRTWRWRRIPPATVRFLDDEPQVRPTPVVYVDALQIREDSTVLLRGTIPLAGRTEQGVWFQRLLPADGQEIPAIPEREADPAPSKPSIGFTHAWDFVGETVFATMNERFSHFGVYEPVHSRTQFYRVTPEKRADRDVAAIEGAVWEDTGHALRHSHQRLDWAAAARILDGGDPRDAVTSRSHPSIFNDPMAFRLVKRPGLGWILVHFDKRDDKLVAFDGVGSDALASVVLTDRANPVSTIRLSVDAHMRNDVRRLHGRRVRDEVDAVTPPQIRKATVTTVLARNGDVVSVEIAFEMARDDTAANAYGGTSGYDAWLSMNVWRVKLGAIIPPTPSSGLGAPQPVILLDRVRQGDFTARTTTTFVTRWAPTAADQRGGRLAEILSPTGRIRYGTSVWFVGATGLACCADELTFATPA